MSTTTTEKPFNLTALLNGEAYPFQADFKGTAYDGLALTYRELPTDILPALAEAVAAPLEALGVDPLAAVLLEIAPDAGLVKGQEYNDFMARRDAFTAKETLAYASAMALVTGKLLSCVIGSWNSDEKITAETCTKLPASLQRKILLLAQAATLGDDTKKNSNG